MNKKDAFEHLKQELLDCRLCQEKFGYEPRPIFHGKQKSKIMQISQAPSLTVYNTLKPFNDLSGKKLRQEWYEISNDVFYNQDNFYITSVGHCYPGKTPSGGDRLPPRICSKTWLQREIDLVENEIYIIIGGAATKVLFPKRNFTSLVFEELTLNNKPAYVMPHPSPLNVKWFMDNPKFMEEKVLEIKKEVHRILNVKV